VAQISTVPFQFRSQGAVEHDETLLFEKRLEEFQ
jgi:hypothetical protein